MVAANLVPECFSGLLSCGSILLRFSVSRKHRGQYLYLYGLLQALYMQQDAASSISKSLFEKGINWESEYPDAYQARELRNDVAGHPTYRNRGEFVIYLEQISLHKESFGYMRYYSDKSKGSKYICVGVQKAIDDTHSCINAVLRKTSEALEAEYQAYIKKFKEVKMRNIFDGFPYAKEKVLANDLLKPEGYRNVKNMVKQCEAELINRYGSVNALGSFPYVLKKIRTAFRLIDSDLHAVEAPTRNEMEQCLQEYLFDRLNELQQLCIEVDETFEKSQE